MLADAAGGWPDVVGFCTFVVCATIVACVFMYFDRKR